MESMYALLRYAESIGLLCRLLAQWGCGLMLSGPLPLQKIAVFVRTSHWTAEQFGTTRQSRRAYRRLGASAALICGQDGRDAG